MLSALILLVGTTQFEWRSCDAGSEGKGRPCCSSCRATEDDYQAGITAGYARRESPWDYLPISGDHIDSEAFRICGAVHGIGATIVLLLVPWQWVLTKGTALHQWRGRALAFAFALLMPTGFLLVHTRVPFKEAPYPRIFPTELQWIGVYHFGLSFVSCVFNALFPPKRGPPRGLRRVLCAGTAVVSLLWGLFVYFAYAVILATAPSTSYEWEVAFWMLNVLYVLPAFDILNILALLQWGAGPKAFVWRDHHKLNMTFAVLECLVAFLTFLAHDAYWIFPFPGLSMWPRVLVTMGPTYLFFLHHAPFILLYAMRVPESEPAKGGGFVLLRRHTWRALLAHLRGVAFRRSGDAPASPLGLAKARILF